MNSAIKKILIVLLIITALLLVCLQALGVSLDKTFWTEALKGVFANILVIFVAIFCIDLINKSEQKKVYKNINKQVSEFIFQKTTALVFTLGESIKLFDEKQVQEELVLLLKESKISNSAENNFLDFPAFSKKFSESYDAAENKILFFENFTKKAKDYLDVVQKNLKEIYPHPSDKIGTLMETILMNLGMIAASLEIFKIARSLKDRKDIGVTEEEFKTFDKSYSHLTGFFYKTEVFGRHVENFFKGLSLLREEARNNDLFSEV